jgi:hypothetical protein
LRSSYISLDFFNSFTEENSKEFVGMNSCRIQFSYSEKQSAELELTHMNREKNNSLDNTIQYLPKEGQLRIQNKLPLISAIVKYFHINILPSVIYAY